MDGLTKGILVMKILEACDCEIDSALYSFTLLEKDLEVCTHNLHNLPIILESALNIFGGKRLNVSKNSKFYINIKKNYEESINLFSNACKFLKHDNRKMNIDEIGDALSLVSHIYFDAFIKPVQFFLPHSSICSGRWDFWDSVNYFDFKDKINDKEFNFNFRNKIIKNVVWHPKFDLNDFPLLVRRRLIKEKLLHKKLNPESMIKAMIIRIGDLGRPFINYEVIDFSIREFFTYLGEKKYQRVDREIEFLRRLDNEIINILKKGIETA